MTMEEIQVVKAWVTETEVWIRTSDGREACERFADYPRLRYATAEERAAFELGTDGIHWRGIGEDLGFEGFFREKQSNPLYDLFMAHPELNASAIARRMGISQSLFAQYVSGTKKPSRERYGEILQTIRNVGREIAAV